MKYLVDADVLSEATKPEPQHQVVDWLRQNDADLVVNPIILGELEYGILLLSAGRKRTRLLEWFTRGARQLNVLPIDSDTANAWARLLADLKRKGRAMPIKDSLIAATALRHGLVVATLNGRDFEPAGVDLVDPSA